MILKGNQRAGGGQLAHHLLNDRDNDHVAIHDLRGFISEDLNGAFTEAFAVSQGTRCKQFLFSLSLNPPENARVPIAVFERAIEKIEERLGLTNQPRAIVFHEKEGRRHAHCVWSRINTAEMKAINLPHYKMRLRDISRQLFLENDWRLPRGLQDAQERDPSGFSQAEHQQAKRTETNAAAIKKIFKECWAASDSTVSFGHALEEHGYCLARGDRRGHVAVNAGGEVFAISRWLDLKAKDVRGKLGDGLSLPSVEEAKAWIAQNAKDGQNGELDEALRQIRKKLHNLETRRVELVKNQRAERRMLSEKQAERRNEENRIRATRLPAGLRALWFRVTGKYQKIYSQNEAERDSCDQRDRSELQILIECQMVTRRALKYEIQQVRYQESVLREESFRSVQKQRDELAESPIRISTKETSPRMDRRGRTRYP
jgi:hypothetical protein